MRIILCLLGMLGLFQEAQSQQTVWVCTITNDKQTWKVENPYQLKALYTVLETCKKESAVPASCHKKNVFCEGYINGVSITPLWKCMGLDANAQAFDGAPSTNKDEAALNAKSACQTNSKIPDTCYAYVVDCKNMHKIQP